MQQATCSEQWASLEAPHQQSSNPQATTTTATIAYAAATATGPTIATTTKTTTTTSTTTTTTTTTAGFWNKPFSMTFSECCVGFTQWLLAQKAHF